MNYLAIVLMAFFLIACEKQGPLHRAGEEADEFIEDVSNGGETMGNKLDDAVDDVKKGVEDAVDEIDPD
ncbi:MAG: hypothetical protein AB8G18_13925 [Gammaproteobacteria bacterium]